MPIRTVLRMGEPKLLQVSSAVDPSKIISPEIQELIQDMTDTMKSLNGAGIAAPQIGIMFRIVIFGFEKSIRYPDALPVPSTVLINPIITPLSLETESGWEGCLSVPGIRGKVDRVKAIRYQGFDQDGNVIDRSVEGFHARVVQHECDHLDGYLFPMRVTDFSQYGFEDVLFKN